MATEQQDRDELAVRRVKRTDPPEVRFWANVDRRGDDECWEWAGHKFWDGYGQFHVKKKQYRAHRYSYELLVAPIPKLCVLDHLCRNRACVNPKHLEPVTNRENLMRGESPTAIAFGRYECPRGHLYDGENTRVTSGGFRVCRKCKNYHDRLGDLQKRDQRAGIVSHLLTDDDLSARLAQAKAEALREFADAHRFLPEWIMFRRNDGSGVTIPDLLRETASRIESEAEADRLADQSCSTCGQPMSTPGCSVGPNRTAGHTIAGGADANPESEGVVSSSAGVTPPTTERSSDGEAGG